MSEPPSIFFDEPVRILSDLHLAHPASLVRRVESLRPLVSGAKTVIFNGDTCELSCAGWRDAAALQLAELKALCAEEGAQPVFLSGNHDPEIAERGWMELAGGGIFVTHGHAICRNVAPWSHEYPRKRKRIREIIRERQTGEPDLAHQWETTRLITEELKPDRTRKLGKRGRKYVLSAVWPPERCFNILRVWLTMVSATNRFASRYCPEAKVLLFGHFHRSGIWQRGGRTICNTGAFMRGSRPLVAELSAGVLRMHPVIQSDQSFHPGAGATTIQVLRERSGRDQ